EPERYLTKQDEPKPLPKGTLYTCPMHPEIVKEGHGHCPICGMALEPMGVPPEITDNPELIDFTRRLKVALPLSLALLALDMGNHVFGIDLLPFLSPSAKQWLQLIIAIPAVLWCGWPFFMRGWDSLRWRRLNMFTLIAMGTGAAFLYSIVATVAPGLFPASMADALRGPRACPPPPWPTPTDWFRSITRPPPLSSRSCSSGRCSSFAP